MSQEHPSFAIIGTGALGGYYGARLAQAGHDVHFLCHRDGPHIREKGLIVESAGRSILHLRAHAYDRPEDMPRCDAVILALKTTANHALPELLPPVVKPGGVVVVMQNGWDVEKDAAAAAPGQLVIGALCFLCANKPAPGYVLHLDYGDILLGWHRETGDHVSADRWMSVLGRCLDDAHIGNDRSPDLRLARWKKLVWNIPYNGLSVAYRTTTDRLMADPARRNEVEAIMREVQGLAAACGCVIEDAFVQKMLDDTERMKPYKTSMLLDFEAGRSMELETMYERPLRAGEDAGGRAPRIRALWERLRALQGG